jgi:hypothetical protein
VRRGIRTFPEGTGVRFFVAWEEPRVPAGRRLLTLGATRPRPPRPGERRGRRQRRLPDGNVFMVGQSRPVAARGIRVRTSRICTRVHALDWSDHVARRNLAVDAHVSVHAH